MRATFERRSTIAAEVGLRRDRQPDEAGTRGGKLTVMLSEARAADGPDACCGRGFTLYPGRAFRKRRDPSAASHNAGVMRRGRSPRGLPAPRPRRAATSIQQADRSGGLRPSDGAAKCEPARAKLGRRAQADEARALFPAESACARTAGFAQGGRTGRPRKARPGNPRARKHDRDPAAPC